MCSIRRSRGRTGPPGPEPTRISKSLGSEKKRLRPSGDPSECKHQRRRHSHTWTTGGARLGGNWLNVFGERIRANHNPENNPSNNNPSLLTPYARPNADHITSVWAYGSTGRAGARLGGGKGGTRSSWTDSRDSGPRPKNRRFVRVVRTYVRTGSK